MQILWLLQSQFITYCLQLVIYINELSDNINSNTTQYADVTKLYSYICHYSILIIIKIMVKMHKMTLIKLQRGLISGSFLKCKHTYAKRKLFFNWLYAYNILDYTCQTRKTCEWGERSGNLVFSQFKILCVMFISYFHCKL